MLGADVSGLAKGMKQAQSSVNAFGQNVTKQLSSLQSKVAGIMAGMAGGWMISQGVSDAMKYEALMTTLGESMGESRRDFEKWQETVGQSMGFSRVMGANLANTLSLNFKKIAVDQEDLTRKTTKMMETAAIISNKRGMLMTEVSDRIRSAMNQEADGADELGVNVRIAAIKTSTAYKEMANGVAWDKLSESMRKTILYEHILESVTTNLGATMQDTTQLRVNAFTASLTDARMALGQAFLPIIYTILPVLTKFMQGLYKAIQMIGQFTRALFGGFEVSPMGSPANIDGITAATDATKGLGDATEEAGKKAKKAAKGSLAAFDQINTLAEKTEDTGGAGGGGGGEGEGIDMGDPSGGGVALGQSPSIYDEISDSIQDMADKLKLFFKESQGWQTIKDGLKSIKDGFTDIMNSKAVRWLGQQIKEDLPDFFDSLATIAGGALKVIGGGLGLIASLLDNDMQKGWEGWGDIISGTWDIFSGTAGLIFPDLGNKMETFGDDFDRLWGWLDEEFISTSETWTEAWEKFGDYLQDKGIDKLEEFKDTAKDSFQNFKWDMITNLFESMKTWDKNWKDSKKPVRDAFDFLTGKSDISMAEFRAAVGRESKKAWDDFKKPFMPAYNWFDENLIQPIKRGLEGFGKGFDVSFGEGLRSLYNDIALRINGLLGGLSQITIAGKYPLSFITRYALPRLAEGGIATRATLAMVGEGSEHEAIAPISKLQGYIATAVADAMHGFSPNNNNGGDIVLNLDGRQFARIVKPYIDKENHRIGSNVRMNPI